MLSLSFGRGLRFALLGCLVQPAVLQSCGSGQRHCTSSSTMSTAAAPGGALNGLGTPLQPCGRDPVTGFYRDGYCRCGPEDRGVHAVCAVVTKDFLNYTRSQGNDLSTPAPHFGFPGLKDGDRWCLCAGRWEEARRAGFAPPVVLESTSATALDVVSLDVLRQYAVEAPGR